MNQKSKISHDIKGLSIINIMQPRERESVKAMKLDKRLNNYIIIDTETSSYNNYIKEFGYIVYNKKGIAKQYYCYIDEIIALENDSAYDNTIQVTPIEQAISELLNDIQFYNAQVYAYNSSFDYRAINNTLKALNSGLSINQPLDLMGLVSNTIALKKDYIKTCKQNKWFTQKGYVSRTTETVYRYISKNYEYIQQHHALDDCIIEMHILEYIRGLRKKPNYTPMHFKTYERYCNAISL